MPPFIYTIDYRDDGSWIIVKMDRSDAEALALAGFAVEAFETLEEAQQARALLARLDPFGDRMNIN